MNLFLLRFLSDFPADIHRLFLYILWPSIDDMLLLGSLELVKSWQLCPLKHSLSYPYKKFLKSVFALQVKWKGK